MLKDVLIYMNCACKSSVYHTKCINDWLEKSRSCPTCRKRYLGKPRSFAEDDENVDRTDAEMVADGWSIFIDPISEHSFWHRRSALALA